MDHTVRKFTQNGELLLTLGTKEQPGEAGAHFNRPTDIALSPSGEMFVSDGYGNSRLHRFSPEGEHILSWGEPGDGPSQFNLPHGIWVDRKGRVLVADRQNRRIQLFTQDGEFLEEWTGLQRPCDIYMNLRDRIYIPELESRFSILDSEGRLLARWGGEKSSAPGLFVALDCAWVDSCGDLYVGEVLEGQRIQKFSLR